MSGDGGALQLTGIARLGLGCSHIASLSTRPGAAEIAALLDQAWDSGIRVFDTADIYGQGDSERRLARIAARPGAVICTKAGLSLGISQKLVRGLKPVLRPVLLRLRRAGEAAAVARQTAQQTSLDPAALLQRLEGSLRRLKRDAVDVFLLHGAQAADLQDGRLYALLDDIRARGLAVRVGVSCVTIEDAEPIIGSGHVDAVQIPVDATTLAAAGPMLTLARQHATTVIAREVLSGAARTPDGIAAALRPLVQDARLSVILTGTTSARHLDDNIAAFRAGLPARDDAPCT